VEDPIVQVFPPLPLCMAGNVSMFVQFEFAPWTAYCCLTSFQNSPYPSAEKCPVASLSSSVSCGAADQVHSEKAIFPEFTANFPKMVK